MPMEERMLERRWERRLLCADLVKIEWKSPDGMEGSATAILEDISRAGACLQTDLPVPVEATIRVCLGRKTLEGMVSYCAYHDIGYFTGIIFKGSQRWSRKLFRPKHMVDPGSLEIVKEAGSG
jgi:hypothetical protein